MTKKSYSTQSILQTEGFVKIIS